MQQELLIHYEWLRALHLIAVISWVAGMLYLPRLFVYHVDAKKGSAQSEGFKVMERRLLKFIINPAMIVTWIVGLSMLYANPALLSEGWMHAKLLFVVLMSGAHGVLAGHTRKFANDANTKTTKYFRILNEIPTVLMVLIIIMAVVEPF